MHAGNGAGLSPRVLGESGGEAAVTLLTTAMPAHTHNAACGAAGGGTDSPTGAVWADAHSGKAPVLAYKGNSTNSNTTMNSQALNLSGGNQPHNNLSPDPGAHLYHSYAGNISGPELTGSNARLYQHTFLGERGTSQEPQILTMQNLLSKMSFALKASLVMALVLLSAVESRAGSISVATTTDSATGTSLRAAIATANANGGTWTISVPAGTYSLSLGDLAVGNG